MLKYTNRLADVLWSLKYFRVKTFSAFKRPFSAWSRQNRMRLYVSLMDIRDGMSVLDLGGHPAIWANVSASLELTILNLPGNVIIATASHHKISYIEQDACQVIGFAPKSFDMVFSNSVIEHVGSKDRQTAFATEARRLGKSYWIQTPSKWFPIEAHCGMPLWWFYPKQLRSYLINRWRKKLPDWTDMVEGTTVITKKELQHYFPEAKIYVERVLGIPKSYVAYYLSV